MRKTLRSSFCTAIVCAPLLFLSSAASGQTLYFDNFDTNTGPNYTVTVDPDSSVLFAYNYSAAGIPSAPNSVGGTTSGVRFEANNGDAVAGAQAINISPTSQSFSGDYVLSFDMWLNANGPFPAGGAGSTQFVTGGVGVTGTSLQKSTAGATGAWFAVDNEGNSGIDFRAYRAATLEGPTSTAYIAPDSGTINRRDANNPYYHGTFPGGQQAPAVQQALFPASADAAKNQEGALKAGTTGFLWREVVITKSGTNVSWSIDGLAIATLTNPTLAGSNVFVGYWDAFNSISNNPAMSFGVIDNLRVDAIPEPNSLGLVAFSAIGALLARRRRHG